MPYASLPLVLTLAVATCSGYPEASAAPPRVVFFDADLMEFPLEQVTFGFSEPVNVPPGAVTVWSVEAGFISHVLTPDETGSFLTIEILEKVAVDRVFVVLDYSITNGAGEALDGEVFENFVPSGDGRPGGQAVFEVLILSGDVDGNGFVDTNDLNILLADFGDPGGGPSDLNQDGFVDSQDLNAVLAGFGSGFTVLDGVVPALVSIDPSPEVPLFGDVTQVVAQFSEPLVPELITPSSVYLIGSDDELYVPSGVELGGVNDVATFTFAKPISQCGSYDIRLSNALIDPSGEQLLPPPLPVDGFVPPVTPVLDPTPVITAEESLVLSGQAIDAVEVEVSGPTGVFMIPVNGGTFSGEVPLQPNKVNTFFVEAISVCGITSSPTTFIITSDQEPPTLFIDFPAAGAQIQAGSTDVAGRVGDKLSGFEGLTVSVNGINAEVDIGIGTNGTFFLPALMLNAKGETVIEAIATDALGNQTTKSISVTQVVPPPGSPLMHIIGGNGQTAPIYQQLDEPIQVQVTKADGITPITNKVVTFKVIKSDGKLAPSDGAVHVGQFYQVLTDSMGMAEAWWQMGTDAGCGNNRLEVTSKDIAGTVVFCASASPGQPYQINIGSGNNQRAETNGPAPMPLRVFVSDGCNGVENVPVTFTVTSGTGFVNNMTEAVVSTGPTGHAEASFLLGPEPGNQRIRATFAGNPTNSAEFVVYGLERTPGAPTTFRGIVLDNASQPIGGSEVRLVVDGVEVGTQLSTTDGQFNFSGFEGSGKTDLYVDGTVATTVGGAKNPMPIDPLTFPGLHFETLTVPEANNSLGMPVLLPRLNPNNVRTYSETEQTILECEGMDGLRMIIEPGSMTLADGTPASEGQLLALNQVHHNDIPMPMPDGAAPPFAWTVYPPEATFDPPITIEYPNMSGLAPGAVAYFLSFDHDTAQFEIVSTGSVSEDGSLITSDQGSGLTVSGWGCNCPPYSVTGECEKCPAGSPVCEVPGVVECDATCNRCKQAEAIVNKLAMEAAGTAGTVLPAQIACIVQKTCDGGLGNDPDSGPCPNWGEGFVTDVMYDFAKSLEAEELPAIPLYPFRLINETCKNINVITELDILDIGIIQWISKEAGYGEPSFTITNSGLCALVSGFGDHFPNELLPFFSQRCHQLDDCKHNELFTKAIVPCFGEIPGLSVDERAIAAASVVISAEIMREIIQAACPTLEALGIANPPEGPVELPDLPPLPPKGALWSATLADIGALSVTAAGEPFFVHPGDEFQLQVTRLLPNGDVEDITDDPDTVFISPWKETVATISEDGVLTVHSCPVPFESLYYKLNVIVVNGTDAGFGQFAIVDVDSDGDWVVDSFEETMGLDPLTFNGPTSDLDGDALSDLHECMLLTDPLSEDTDGDGLHDGLEVVQGSDPRFPSLMDGRLIGVTGVQVGAQATEIDVDGQVLVGNIAAADQFGPNGPGSVPDFLSDDALRFTASFERYGTSYYAFSEPFQIEQGATYLLDEFTITDVPPPLPVAIDLDVCEGCPVVLEPDQAIQLVTTATLGDGSTVDVTPYALWTTYRTSNPVVATVDQDGLVTAHSKGAAFITATNDSATSVLALAVDDGTFPTTVTGVVYAPSGAPAAFASVMTVPYGGVAITDFDGSFSLSLQNVVPGDQQLSVSATLPGFAGSAGKVTIVPFGLTDAGIINLGGTSTTPIFGNPATLVCNARTVASGDLNGDGAPDVVVGSHTCDYLAVLLNNGEGILCPPVTYEGLFANPASIAIGDLDLDGDNDVVVVDAFGLARVMMNAGDGTLALDGEYPVGDGPESVAIADLDGDGDADMAVANRLSDNVSILLNLGDGTFAEAEPYGVGEDPRSLALDDLDGDGDVDLAVTNIDSHTVSILMNLGNGTFEPASQCDTSFGPWGIASGDIDGDGDSDLAVVSFSIGTVGVFLNSGDGTFAPEIVYGSAASDGSTSIAMGDVDGDDDLDIAVSSIISEDTAVLLNDGEGVFASEAIYSPGGAQWSTAMDDFDSDGSTDLVVANFSRGVDLLLNDDNGLFSHRVFQAGDAPISIVADDFDGDGDFDLAVANSGFSSSVSVLLNDGYGAFAQDVEYSAGGNPYSVAAADLDNDGDTDLVVANVNEVSVLFNGGGGTFLPPAVYEADGFPWRVAIGDLDGDGDPDLAVAGFESVVSILLNMGDGTFALAVPYALEQFPSDIVAADLDGDLDLDLALTTYDNTVTVLLNEGDSSFAAPVAYPVGGDLPSALVAGDLDGDGRADLSVASSDRIEVLVNNGDGTFDAYATYGMIGATAVSSGDIDNDGDADLVVAGGFSTVGVFLNNGDATFTVDVRYGAGRTPMDLAIVDLDGDGDQDLAVANSESAQSIGGQAISVLLSRLANPPAESDFGGWQQQVGDLALHPIQSFELGPLQASPSKSATGGLSAQSAALVDASGNGSGVRALIGRQGAAASLREPDGRAIDMPNTLKVPAGAFAISPNGQIVVGQSMHDDGTLHAFAWTNAGGTQDLNDLLAEDAPWQHLTTADGVTNDGVVTGLGVLLNGEQQQRYEIRFDLPTLPGDLNDDCVIDKLDLQMVLESFGCETPCAADADGDGRVDTVDLELVLAGFGEACAR